VRITLRAERPMEPVDPSMVTYFMLLKEFL